MEGCVKSIMHTCGDCGVAMEYLPDMDGSLSNTKYLGCKDCNKVVELRYGSLAGENPEIISIPFTYEEYMLGIEIGIKFWELENYLAKEAQNDQRKGSR